MSDMHPPENGIKNADLHRYRQGFTGNLKKQGKINKKWKNFTAVLGKKSLKCFEDEQKTALQSELVVDETLQLYDVPGEVDGTSFCFYLIGKTSTGADEVMLLAAATDEDKNVWIEAISDAVHGGFKQVFQPDLFTAGGEKDSVLLINALYMKR